MIIISQNERPVIVAGEEENKSTRNRESKDGIS